MKKYISLLIFLAFNYFGLNQVVNGYARVTNISGAILSVTDVDESADTFEDGEWIVLMQMQDDVIGGTGNNASFGSLGDIESAGLYEIRQIESHTESGGVPNAITLVNPPGNTYSTGANMRVQIITFRQLGSPNYTSVADMAALPWDGDIGGVLAVYVPGIFTLNHNISADGDGFRGGGTNLGGSIGCTPTGAYRVIEQDDHANKGEGIYRNTTANRVAGRGRILNGGGGGNSHNAGGGGGGNFSAGGQGGPGWNNCSPSAGGLGGLNLSSEISVSRVFMGGGGGAGEGNNNYATEGANGGGIILIKAQEIRSTSCASITISANGASITIAPGNDGGGGGGGGGSIVFEVDSWNIDADCPLTISASGGDGGAVGNSGTHGGGGGGGQGIVFFSTAEPTTNVDVETLTGEGGCNNNSSPCNSRAADGEGPDNSGIMDILTGPLPIELVDFNAELSGPDRVILTWKTKSERNNDFFTLERSADGENWISIGQINGAGNSNSEINYQFYDENPIAGLSYYKLKQTDFNGDFSYSEIESILRTNSTIHIYPNPGNSIINVDYPNLTADEIYIVDGLGKTITPRFLKLNESQASINIASFPAGIYYLVIQQNEKMETLRFTVVR